MVNFGGDFRKPNNAGILVSPHASDQRSVVEFIREDSISGAKNCIKETHACSKAGGEEKTSLLVQKLGQRHLQVFVVVCVATQKRRTGRPSAKLLKSRLRSCYYFGVRGQTCQVMYVSHIWRSPMK